MSYSSLIAIVVTTILLPILHIYILHPLFLSPLRSIPAAHPTARLTSLWIKYHRRNSSQALAAIRTAHLLHGPIVRLSPTEISITSYEAAYRVYVEKGGFAKPEWWADTFTTFGVRNLVSMIGGAGDKEHAGRKRDMGNVYAKSVLVGSSALRETAGRVLGGLVGVVDRLVEGGEKGIMDVFDFNGAVNADFVAAYLFGSAPPGSTKYTQDGTSREEFLKYVGGFFKGDADADTWLENLMLQRCEQLSSSPQETYKDAIVYNQLTSRNVTGNDRASEILDHYLAGTEAPRIILTYLEWEVSKRPAIQQKLHSEVQAFLSTVDRDEVPDFKALDALPFLDAVLTETLRLYTPTPGPQPRITPPAGTTIHGHFIPGKTQIHASLGILHRNPSVFPQPLEWNPSRWVTSSKEQVEEMRRYFWAFNKGPRICIGKDFTLIVMKLIIATIYARYETRVVDDEGMESQIGGHFAQAEGEKLVLEFRRY